MRGWRHVGFNTYEVSEEVAERSLRLGDRSSGWVTEYLRSNDRREVAGRRANDITPKSPLGGKPLATERTNAERPSMSEAPVDWAKYQLSPTNEAIAIKLYDGIQSAMTRRGLRWRPVPRSGWIVFQRDESKSVLGIQLNSATIKMWVKLPESPEQLLRRGKKIADPYPRLVSFWRAKDKQWEWDIPTMEAIPDLAPAIDLARHHH